MKKLLKKLKKNQLLSKISACMMIFVILVSCLGVSTFAADETEAEAEYVIPAGTYTWVESPFLTSGSYSFEASLTCNSVDYSGFGFDFDNELDIMFFGYFPVYPPSIENPALLVYVSGGHLVLDFVGWRDEAYRTFTLNEDVTTDEATYTAFIANIEKPIPHTDSVLDVFTGINDSIMSLLGSAQGVFISNSGSTPFIFGEVSSSSFVVPILNFPSVSIGSSFDISVIDPESGLPVAATLTIYDGSEFPISGLSCSMFGVVSLKDDPSNSNIAVFFDLITSDVSYDGWTSTFDFEVLNPSILGFPSLTFLGTLAVLGVGLAIVFLLIGLISNFLKNRG